MLKVYTLAISIFTSTVASQSPFEYLDKLEDWSTTLSQHSKKITKLEDLSATTLSQMTEKITDGIELLGKQLRGGIGAIAGAKLSGKMFSRT